MGVKRMRNEDLLARPGQYPTVEDLLTDERLRDVAEGAYIAYWADELTRSKIHTFFYGEGNRGRLQVSSFEEMGESATGTLTKARFRDAIIRRALDRYLDEILDEFEGDVALQIAIFGDVIYS